MPSLTEEEQQKKLSEFRNVRMHSVKDIMMQATEADDGEPGVMVLIKTHGGAKFSFVLDSTIMEQNVATILQTTYEMAKSKDLPGLQ